MQSVFDSCDGESAVSAAMMKNHEQLMRAQTWMPSGVSRRVSTGRTASSARAASSGSRGEEGRVAATLLGPPSPRRTFVQRFVWLLLSVLLRRHGVLLLVPLFYVSGMLLYMSNGISLDSAPCAPPPPSLLYRSPNASAGFWPEMQHYNNAYYNTTTFSDNLHNSSFIFLYSLF